MLLMLPSVVHGMDGRPVAFGGTVAIPNGTAIRRYASTLTDPCQLRPSLLGGCACNFRSALGSHALRSCFTTLQTAKASKRDRSLVLHRWTKLLAR